MSTDPRIVARDYMAAITEAETDAFVTEARAPATQLTDADLASMAPAQINQARRDGRLDSLLGKN